MNKNIVRFIPSLFIRQYEKKFVRITFFPWEKKNYVSCLINAMFIMKSGGPFRN